MPVFLGNISCPNRDEGAVEGVDASLHASCLVPRASCLGVDAYKAKAALRAIEIAQSGL